MKANGYSEGTETPPDLKEGFCVGGRTITGHADIDAAWFPENVFPDKVAVRPGSGSLQVFTEQGGWADAPFDPEALTVDIGDLLAYWSGDRWLSGRPRALAPQPSAPDEDLLSLSSPSTTSITTPSSRGFRR